MEPVNDTPLDLAPAPDVLVPDAPALDSLAGLPDPLDPGHVYVPDPFLRDACDDKTSGYCGLGILHHQQRPSEAQLRAARDACFARTQPSVLSSTPWLEGETDRRFQALLAALP